MSGHTQNLELGGFVIAVALDAGPRILGFRRHGGPELFADVPDAVIESDAGRLPLLGGHRLWSAPEIPMRTYQPDERAVEIVHNGSVTVTGPTDGAGFNKAIELRVVGEYVIVDHALTNAGTDPVRIAPWAITQLAPGGVAVVPLADAPVDAHALLPSRSLVLWPYSDLSAAEFELRSDEIRVHASQSTLPAKIGVENRRGWLAYRLEDELFVKWAPLHDDSLAYADRDASMQCYRNDAFLELETLGPLVDLAPSETVHHRELWSLIDLAGRSLEAVLASLPMMPEEMNG